VTMDRTRIKELVTQLAEAVGLEEAAKPPGAEHFFATTPTSDRILAKIVLGDILDDSILSAKAGERTFPLRLFFGELGSFLTKEGDAADHAFTLASGLNFFFRADMDAENKVRVAIEVSRSLYTFAASAKLDPEVLSKAAPLLAALMSGGLERVKLESVDHVKMFDSQIHERTGDSDPSGPRIVRPASFLCRVSANNAVKAKAQVVT
jgi:hypothetical protein